MKNLIAVLLVVSLLVGCGHPQTFEGKDYPTYGFFNADTDKSKKICYSVSVGNVVWSIITIETVVLPIYFIGFSLFNPTSLKKNGECNGIDGD
jgi:hypothetical protein